MDKTTLDSIALIPWIGKTAKHIDYYIADYMRERGIDLSKEQFIVMKYLSNENGLIQNDLAFITNRSKTALTRLIQTMEKKGLVFRKTSTKDLRINHVYLTDFGRETWERSQPHFQEVIDELQQGISEKDIRKVRDIMIKIQENIKLKTNINQK